MKKNCKKEKNIDSDEREIRIRVIRMNFTWVWNCLRTNLIKRENLVL